MIGIVISILMTSRTAAALADTEPPTRPAADHYGLNDAEHWHLVELLDAAGPEAVLRVISDWCEVQYDTALDGDSDADPERFVEVRSAVDMAVGVCVRQAKRGPL